MKVRNPRNRFDLRVSKRDYVLDVGGGHNPHPRANVVVDKFTESNYHRSGDIRILNNQEFIQADGEMLPFKDKEFDYVICCHVLEHVENPYVFLKELFRVGKRGYIETPSLLGEYLAPRESHKWILHEVNNTLCLVDKSGIGFSYGYYLGDLVQEYLPRNSIGFKILERTHPSLMTIRIEWDDSFEFSVEPKDPEIRKYFSGKWEKAWSSEFFPPRTVWAEFLETVGACKDIVFGYIKSRGRRH